MRGGDVTQTGETIQGAVLDLKIGEVVEVRSEAEILATLDDRGELESLPFMPEMLKFCGQRFTVDKRAFKLCDTIEVTGLHRMDNAVHLRGVRCDGQAHGGCQAACLVYWKEAWLKRADADHHQEVAASPVTPGATLLPLLMEATHKPSDGALAEEAFSCQATELLRAAPARIPPWDIGQYVEDVRSGNVGFLTMLRSVIVGFFNEYQDLSRKFLPRWLRIHDGARFPFIDGTLQKTPSETLDLQPGELVRIKSKEEIVGTLDTGNRNRGMKFDPEQLKFCGRQARVLGRVEQIIDEKSGKMMHLKNPCIVLEGVICPGEYHRLCPRGTYPYWREIWLERV
jgi:hypothetical protein